MSLSFTILKVSEMLAGKEICVINGTNTHSKSDLEKKIIEFGGTIVQNPGWSILFLPPANEVWGKVIFLHLFVILWGGHAWLLGGVHGCCGGLGGAWLLWGGMRGCS